ncbi:MAG: hypothetical protein ACTHNP_11150, partial [Solirubrobacterales bacterium]
PNTSLFLSELSSGHQTPEKGGTMKHLKTLALAALAAAALTAFAGAGSASATVFCKTNLTSGCAASGWDYPAGTVIEFSSTTEAVDNFDGGPTLDTCIGSRIKAKTANTGSSTETVKGPIEELDWGNCTNKTTTIVNGEFETHWIPGTDNATVTIIGTQWTISTIFGSCVYTASDIGTLVGGNPATIEIKEQSIKLVSGPCPSETKWTESFAVTSPKPLFVSTS